MKLWELNFVCDKSSAHKSSLIFVIAFYMDFYRSKAKFIVLLDACFDFWVKFKIIVIRRQLNCIFFVEYHLLIDFGLFLIFKLFYFLSLFFIRNKGVNCIDYSLIRKIVQMKCVFWGLLSKIISKLFNVMIRFNNIFVDVGLLFLQLANF